MTAYDPVSEDDLARIMLEVVDSRGGAGATDEDIEAAEAQYRSWLIAEGLLKLWRRWKVALGVRDDGEVMVCSMSARTLERLELLEGGQA